MVTFDNTNVSSATTELTTSYVEYIAAAVSEDTYVYIKNLSTTSNVLMANAASQEWGIVLPGEWNFFSVVGGKGLEFKGSSSGVDVEYALFRKPRFTTSSFIFSNPFIKDSAENDFPCQES